jgi:hypothetical protein
MYPSQQQTEPIPTPDAPVLAPVPLPPVPTFVPAFLITPPSTPTNDRDVPFHSAENNRDPETRIQVTLVPPAMAQRRIQVHEEEGCEMEEKVENEARQQTTRTGQEKVR